MSAMPVLWAVKHFCFGPGENFCGTVGPRTERPQAERVSQLNDFELGPN